MGKNVCGGWVEEVEGLSGSRWNERQKIDL